MAANGAQQMANNRLMLVDNDESQKTADADWWHAHLQLFVSGLIAAICCYAHLHLMFLFIKNPTAKSHPL